jgi:formylglycine-generating enzyme required for sulfatase activity
MNEHTLKILRGGSWFSSRRGAYHSRNLTDDFDDDLGFRVMRVPGGPDTWCMLRGGSWSLVLDSVRADFRHYSHPDYRYVNLGFRVMERSL